MSKRLDEARLKHDLTVQDICAMADISESYWSLLVVDKKIPSFPVACYLSLLFGEPLNALFPVQTIALRYCRDHEVQLLPDWRPDCDTK